MSRCSRDLSSADFSSRKQCSNVPPSHHRWCPYSPLHLVPLGYELHVTSTATLSLFDYLFHRVFTWGTMGCHGWVVSGQFHPTMATYMPSTYHHHPLGPGHDVTEPGAPHGHSHISSHGAAECQYKADVDRYLYAVPGPNLRTELAPNLSTILLHQPLCIFVK